MSEPEPGLVLRWRTRRRRHATSLGVIVALAVLAWLAFGGSFLNDWGVFIASAKRSNAGGVPTGGRWERDETHLLLGRGRVLVYRMRTYSDNFSRPGSTTLAWAVMRNSGPHPLFSSGGAGRPFIDLPVWPVASILTVLAGVLAWKFRRLPGPGRCVACGYDLTANADRADLAARCPECGVVQPCLVCGQPLLGVTAQEPCPGCGWNRRAQPRSL